MVWRLWRTPVNGGIHICGCGHSGTSILTRLIGAHSCVLAIQGETGIAKKERFSIYSNAVSNFWDQTRHSGKQIWVEKTPKHVRHLNFILNSAPDSKIILISRHPFDTIASMKKRYGSFQKALWRWCHDNKILIRHKSETNSYFIRYEDLIEKPRNSLTPLMSHVGLQFEEAQLNYNQQSVDWYFHNESRGSKSELSSSHKALRNQQINQPLNKKKRSFSEILNQEELQVIFGNCTKIASNLGYNLSEESYPKDRI